MEFRESKAIYLQITDYVSEQILLQNWKINEKILSVRELAARLEVNPNTVARAYELLQGQELIQNKRGIGFFVNADAIKKIKILKREAFKEKELPQFFRNIYLLDIAFDDLREAYNMYIKNINLSAHENK